MALRTWALPVLVRLRGETDRAQADLRRQLGREPSEKEVRTGLVARMSRAE